ncbi:MAG: dihydrodipicolinate synthase family protein, partial [Armatimonadetes bacterium]|nr:dihydrodipicolinate synthase family protein [Armatimonadota bacterium]
MSASQARMAGVFPILVTPFDTQGRVDEESLRRLVEFNVEAGVHGLGIALGSEVLRLSEAERVQVTRIVVDQVRQRVPVVVNTGAQGTDLAVLYSRTAEENGADALMVMPPTAIPCGPAEVREYFRAISDAVRIPIFIQDTPTTPVSGGLSLQIAGESEQVRYVKVESAPPAQKVAEAVAQAGDLLTIFGGAGGNYFIEELRRGSRGTMPGCSQPEVFVAVWNCFAAGDLAGARAAFDRGIAPVNRIAGQTWGAFYHVHKEILRRRGILSCAAVRGPMAPLDELTRRELDEVIAELYDGEGR